MIYSVNYADKKWANAQKLNSVSAMKIGKVDKVISYNDSMIDSKFKKNNFNILSQKRGNGYWLWKPYFVNKALQSINYGDYLFYTDSGSCFINDVHYLIKKLEEDKNDIMCFKLDYKEKKYTKRDAFILMNCDSKEYYDSPQFLAGFILIKKTKRTVNLVKDWLYYAQDYRIITDSENECGKNNYISFVENRHDQTAFSLTCKKYNCIGYIDPSQNGNKLRMKGDYPQILDLHRYYFVHNRFEIIIFRIIAPILVPIYKKLKSVVYDK